MTCKEPIVGGFRHWLYWETGIDSASYRPYGGLFASYNKKLHMTTPILDMGFNVQIMNIARETCRKRHGLINHLPTDLQKAIISVYYHLHELELDKEEPSIDIHKSYEEATERSRKITHIMTCLNYISVYIDELNRTRHKPKLYKKTTREILYDLKYGIYYQDSPITTRIKVALGLMKPIIKQI